MKVETIQPRQNRVVIDTNVWLSAALSQAGAPAQVVKRVLAQGVPLFSNATFAEFKTRLWKPKFDRYLSMATRQGILHDALALAHWVDISEDIAAQRICRDGEDDKFIHTALAASAMWLVTGDQDLLVLRSAMDLRIVAPAEVLTMKDFCP